MMDMKIREGTRSNTKFLVPHGTSLGPALNSVERREGIDEIDQVMNGIMRDKEMVVSFYSLGPLGTEFAIPCVQVTDSFYVAHSEDILYRQGYELFRKRQAKRSSLLSYILQGHWKTALAVMLIFAECS